MRGILSLLLLIALVSLPPALGNPAPMPITPPSQPVMWDPVPGEPDCLYVVENCSTTKDSLNRVIATLELLP